MSHVVIFIQRMRKPFLRNLCPEAKEYQETKQNAKLAAMEKRMFAQMNRYKDTAGSKGQAPWRRTAVAA